MASEIAPGTKAVFQTGDDVRIVFGGVKGQPGTGQVAFEFVRETPNTLWAITHNMGYRPAGVVVIDSNGDDVEPVVHYVNQNSILLTFLDPTAGTAYIS